MKAGHQGRRRPQVMFTDLGIKYVGPVDGHDERGDRVRAAPRQAASARPVIVHAVTRKGMGYAPAENHDGGPDARHAA